MQKTVLVAESDAHIALLIQTNLEHWGYRTFLATNGTDALKMIGIERPDVVVSEVSLPFLSGFEMIQRLKQDQILANTPVIFLSSLVQDEDIRQGIELGASAYLSKPFEPKELAYAVANA
jgi:CheY-like chemotaxis protein